MNLLNWLPVPPTTDESLQEFEVPHNSDFSQEFDAKLLRYNPHGTGLKMSMIECILNFI
jgi:hypothetical protein